MINGTVPQRWFLYMAKIIIQYMVTVPSTFYPGVYGDTVEQVQKSGKPLEMPKRWSYEYWIIGTGRCKIVWKKVEQTGFKQLQGDIPKAKLKRI